ncbi:hypothetical protein G5B39_02230 [Rhodobacteraceae bacterium SC52]|nr:hypothetical protein G5B39_02230 [Rhodobacteraceae bacterium SC52]
MVEEGRRGLGDALTLHLPDIAAMLQNDKTMTLWQFARHTAGVFTYTDNAPDGAPGLMEGVVTDRAALLRQVVPQDMIDFAQ